MTKTQKALGIVEEIKRLDATGRGSSPERAQLRRTLDDVAGYRSLSTLEFTYPRSVRAAMRAASI